MPRDATVPADNPYAVVAGRCIGSDREAGGWAALPSGDAGSSPCAFAAARATAAPEDGPRQERVKASGPDGRAGRAGRTLEWPTGVAGVPEKL
ncbi:hypothetical protein NRF20_23950 [Streptomyces sp. R-74717]|uniref:hypothetical protein n=1 Tax=Streptomyces sp. R-74717 TaxID=2969820 RepID=UPI0039B57EED